MGKTVLRWIENKMMIITDSNGHSIVVGRNPEPETSWIGVKPSDLLLMAVAACATWDVVEILIKQHEPLVDLRVETSGDQISEPPYRFTRIHNHYIVTGKVNPKKLEKAIRLAEDKYCSVISTLRPGVPISSDFEINE
jgi:putative redox protein